MYNCKFK